MFRRVISNPSLRRVVVLSHGKRSVKVSGEVSSYSRREFSSFKDVLDKVNKEADRANKEGGNTKSKEEEEEPVKPQVARPEGAPVIGLLNRVRSLAEVFISNIKEAHQELFGEKKTSTLIRKVHQADSYRRPSKNSENEEEEEEGREASGPSDLVVVTSAKSPWEAMRDRLADSPFIREVLKSSKQYSKAVADTSIGKQASKIGQSVRDKIEDAREFWETSQNPIVYAVAGAIENLTGETEEGMAVREIKKLDPSFIKEEWAEEIRRNVAPMIIKAHLQGDLKTLRPWLGEAVMGKLSADIRIRKQDGLVFDSNLLALDENLMLVRLTEHMGPVILMVYMVQQINCIKNRKGEIIEGGEDQIRAKFYSIAFRQVYEEDDSTVRWEIADYELAGDTPYL